MTLLPLSILPRGGSTDSFIRRPPELIMPGMQVVEKCLRVVAMMEMMMPHMIEITDTSLRFIHLINHSINANIHRSDF